ncbi:hypothetical protein RB614_37540 [Phytohabitans sp. ZYX-F-186]|uniref:Uncharacterized protein n=1 Tax=Phytohabitans maris TaxID=3071409 RepID=A0ABU0ZT56_9ACTN|nr:hypothetical protein [Phytohabitans sp. ZYX-F-186]MDQ7910215.1 hypothetical protein [Phytohabitans sp. ZYX-F-186]
MTATGKPAPRRKRAAQPVENAKFDAFVRRILRAYGRRVAAGDIEALASLARLSSEVDATTRLAVASLKNGPYKYSWQEIADRLGTSRQAAQMRYGDKPATGATLDRRLVEAGMGVTVATLVEVFADHHPGVPAASVCPGCGFRYTDKQTACPSYATVRPLLYRRRHEDQKAVNQLTTDQTDDLHGRSTTRKRAAARQATRPTSPPPRAIPTSLFDAHNPEVTS